MKKLLCILLLLLLLTGCGLTDPAATLPDPLVPTAPTSPTTLTDPALPGEALTVHFIDVGQADCALLECGGEYMLIDGGNKADGSLVVSYLQQQGVTTLEAVVCTHAHEDHVGGLPSVLAVYETLAVYAPTRTYSSNIFDDFVFYTDQQGLQITIPAPGDTFALGGAQVTVLGPVQSYAETNDTSIVLKVTYGQTSFLFTGDMETPAENDMLDYWGEGYDWHVDVLKVGHHGSDTSTGYRFLNAVMPAYGILSVGKDNSYGHPHELPMSRLEDAEVTVLRTDTMGHILFVSDGQNLTVTWQNASVTPETPDDTEQSHPDVIYIGNKNSKKFHLPTCRNLPAEANRVELESYEQAIAQGYSPCGNCLGGS